MVSRNGGSIYKIIGRMTLPVGYCDIPQKHNGRAMTIVVDHLNQPNPFLQLLTMQPKVVEMQYHI